VNFRILCSCFFNICLAFVLVSCGSKKGDSGNSQNESSGVGQVIRKMNPRQVAALEDWKNRLVKGCSGNSAFKLKMNYETIEYAGIDLEVLLKQTNNTMLIKDGSGSFAILGRPISMYGKSKQKFKFEITVNGIKQILEGETKRDGFKCELYLYGEKIHEIQLAGHLRVNAVWTPEKAFDKKYIRTWSVKHKNFVEHDLDAITSMGF